MSFVQEFVQEPQVQQQVKPREVQELDLMGTIKEGMQETILEGGVERFIHVNPDAIRENAVEGKNYPTIVVHQDDLIVHCHALRIMGPAMLKPRLHDEDGPASVYIVSHNELAMYVDPQGTPAERIRGCF